MPAQEIELKEIEIDCAISDDELAMRAAEFGQERFDLGSGPLFRAVLMRVAPEDHLLVIVVHHIASDGWSMMVLVREFTEFYNAAREGRPASLPALPVQYADYAQWQRSWMGSEKLQKDIGYWKEKLADAPVLDLPSDYIRPPVQRHVGARQTLALSAQLSSDLVDLSRRQQTTLFIVLTAAMKTLLHRYTGSYDIAVGAPVAGRNRPELDSLVGCFLNTIVIRTAVPENASFIQLIERVRDVALDAYAHEDIPFEKILEEVNPKRELSHTPLFQVFLNMLKMPEPSALTLSGIAAEIFPLPEATAKFDLTLYIDDRPSGIVFSLVYNTELFSQKRMAGMLEQLEHLLAQAIENPGRKLSEFSLVTAAAQLVLPDPYKKLDSRWEGAVHELFQAHAARSPFQLAVCDPHVMWSYRQLDALSNQLAHYLAGEKLAPGNVVAVYAHRSAPLVAALLGIMKAGAAFLVLDPAYPDARLLDYLEIAQPRAWLQLEAAGAVPDAVERFLTASGCSRFLVPASSRKDFEEALAGLPSNTLKLPVRPDDIAYISFTSGSTGRPKGVLGRHGPLTHFVPWLVETFAFNASDRFSLFSALSHDPLHRDVFTPLTIGASVFIPHPEEWRLPEKATAWMDENNITVSHLTPAMGQLLTEGRTKASRSLDSLRYVFFVGDALTRRDVFEIYKLAPFAACVNYFGSTETQRAVSFYRIPREAPNAAGSWPRPKDIVPLGHGIRDVQLLVLNRERQLAGIGEAGEIYVRSPHLAAGYLGEPGLSEEKFVRSHFTGDAADRMYKAGDLGRYLTDGSVETLGRSDTQVKIRGFRVELGEIEAVLKDQPHVRAAAVIAWQGPSETRQLAAYIVLDEEHSGWKQELLKAVSARLPDYMVPAAFVVLKELPLTPNGKLGRRALPPPVAGDAGEGDLLQPSSPEEELVAGIFADVLKKQQVSVNANFFEIGGHSLLATQVITRVRSTFEVELPLRALFEVPTVAGLARRISEMRGAGQITASPLVRVARQGHLPLSYAQQRLWFSSQMDPDNPFYNLVAALRLIGPLDAGLLRRSFNELIRRHEILRTIYVSIDGLPGQVIKAEAEIELPLIKLTEARIDEREAAIQRLVKQEALRPFDLSREVPVRGLLIRLDDTQNVIVVVLHHIASDGWSVGILVREIAALYNAFASGHRSPLPELPIQYADFANWQRRPAQEQVFKAQLEFWRRCFENAPPMLDLPTDRPRSQAPSYRASRHSMEVPAEVL